MKKCDTRGKPIFITSNGRSYPWHVNRNELDITHCEHIGETETGELLVMMHIASGERCYFLISEHEK